MQGRRIDLGEFEMLVKADADMTDGIVSVLEATEPPGFGPPIHVHDDAAEAFYVLEGEYVMSLDGTQHRCRAGSFIFIPAGVPHGSVSGMRQVGSSTLLSSGDDRILRRSGLSATTLERDGR